MLIFLLQSLPIFLLKPINSIELKGKYVNVYYQSEDKKGGEEIFQVIEENAKSIQEKLEFQRHENTNVYVYSKQSSLWFRKYGLITALGAPKWYIGDNRKDKVLIISPYFDAAYNDHDSIISAVIHEYVHTINYQINSKLSYWLDNGVATFLSHQVPRNEQIDSKYIPTMDDINSEDEVNFGNMGGYQFSYTYIDFLNKIYGWDKVLLLIKGDKSCNEIFSKSDKEVYSEWVNYIKENYKN